jgi:hypothetical protein
MLCCTNPPSTIIANRYLDADGELVPTDDFGRPLDPQTGRLLPTNRLGQFLYSAPDRRPPPIAGLIVTALGEPMPRDGRGRFLDFQGRPIPVDGQGRPLGRDGQPLAQNSKGQFVWPEKWKGKQPTTEVVGPDGLPMAGQVQTSEEAKPLPRDPELLSPEPAVPVVDRQGRPLPTDGAGQFLDSQGEPLPVDQQGRPLDPVAGRPLPTDRHGQFVYTPPGLGWQPTPATRQFASPLPTDSQGRPVTLEPAPEEPLDEAEEDRAQTLPTDGTGRQIFPVIGADSGLPLARNFEGRHVNAQGEVGHREQWRNI